MWYSNLLARMWIQTPGDALAGLLTVVMFGVALVLAVIR